MASDEAKAGAIGLVNDFRSRGLSMWGAIRREQLADGLITRINDPTKISSRASQLCGAASAVYNLAQADPSAYARLAIDLYEKGEGKVKSLTIKPSADLRKTAVPGGNDAADWIVLASLRDSDRCLRWSGRALPSSTTSSTISTPAWTSNAKSGSTTMVRLRSLRT